MAKNKKRAIKAHFERRSLERIGVLLNEKEIIKKIQAGKLEFVERQSNRVTVFKYDFNGGTYRVIYDKIRKQIITVLFDKKEAQNGKI